MTNRRICLSNVIGLLAMLSFSLVSVPASHAKPVVVSGQVQEDPVSDKPELVRSVDGYVRGAEGALSGATVRVVFSEPTVEPLVVTSIDPGEILESTTYTTDAFGRYQIKVPEELLGNPLLRLSIKIDHDGYFTRQLGPLPVSDFRGQSIETAEQYWLHRQQTRAAIQQTQMRKGRPLTGKIVTADGTPVERATVVMQTKYRPYSWKFHDPNDYSVSITTQTNMIGEFSMLADERSTLMVTANGLAPLVIDNLEQYASPVRDDPPHTYRLPTPITTTGRIERHDGTPIPHAVLRITRSFGWDEFDMPVSFGRACVADEEGRYSLPPLPAGQYQITVNSALVDPADVEDANETGQVNSLISTPTTPIGAVILSQQVALNDRTPAPTFNLRAIEHCTVTVSIEIDESLAPQRRAPKIPISGNLNGQPWTGVSIKADANPDAQFIVPKGVENLLIEPGSVRVRMTPSDTFEATNKIHLGTIDSDIGGITIRIAKPVK